MLRHHKEIEGDNTMVTGMYSYETYASRKSKEVQGPSKPRADVGYFKLIDDGDEAIVRFAYDDPSELVMAHVHDEPVGKNKHRRVLCLRENARDDMEKCPLCARGDKFSSKVYIKLIEYVKDENGKVVAQAKIWERPESFADEIVEYITNYGGLKDVVFKIKRKGIRGSKDTNYILTPMPSTVYNEANGYAKDFSEFDNFYFYPHSFLSKTKEDIEEYVRTGEFPFHKRGGDEPISDKPAAQEEAPQESQSYMPQMTRSDNTQNVRLTQSEEEHAAPQQPQQEVRPQPQPQAPTRAPEASDPFTARPRRRYDLPESN